MIGGVARWLGRKALLFAALVAAIMLAAWASRSLTSLSGLRQEAATLARGEGVLREATVQLSAESDRRIAAAQRLSAGEMNARIAAAGTEQRRLSAACGDDLGALLKGGAAGVIENRRSCFHATLAAREVTALTVLRDSLDARRPGEDVAAAVHRQTGTMRRAAAVDRAARAELARLHGDAWPDLLQGAAVGTQQRRIAAAAASYRAAERRGRMLLAGQPRLRQATAAARAGLDRAMADYRKLVRQRALVLADSLIERLRAWAAANDLPGVLRKAALAFAGIMLSPLLIRLFCYYVVAPAAMRRPAIRLSAGDGEAAPIPPVSRSAASVAVRLAAGEELLVRQDYLQSTSLVGEKRTRGFLDPWRPLTGFATGLYFLTEIRGAGETTTISARRDPFAEVTIVTLPAGAACVLQPRALAAVAQPVDRPLRVTSRWRLGSLNAWLTLQLRFLVFHGPARLVVKGARGVRVEPAERGRVFGQDQLIGFSADLAYAVTRTETFWPYLLGREPLFKDRVAGGGGMLVLEEAPLALRGGAARRRGIEGMIDAGMKLFGM